MKKYFKMLWRCILYFAVYYLCQIGSSYIYSIILVRNHSVGSVEKLDELLYKNSYMILVPAAVISILIYYLLFKIRKESFRERCSFKKLQKGIKNNVFMLALAAGSISTSLVYFTQNIFKDYAEVSKNMSAGLTSLPGILAVIIIAPILEEILFRGLIFNELRENLNITVSLIIQAAFFGLAHGNSLQGIYAFILGIIAGLIYVWTKSIYANMLLHIVFNLSGTFIFPILMYYTQRFSIIYLIIGVTFTTVYMFKIYSKRTRKSLQFIEQ